MKFENMRDLGVLVEAARAGSLTGAAQAMGITPSAASAMLKRLEAATSARLIERSTRALRLTAQGQMLLDYANRALDLLEEGGSQVASNNRALIGTVHVAAPSGVARTVLLPLLDRFLDEHRGVQLVLSVSDRLQDVTRDAVDLALRYGELADSGLVARPLIVSRRVACAAPGYLARHGSPAHPQELAHHNCLWFHTSGRPLLRWRFERDGAWTEVRIRGDRGSDDAAIAHQWALAGTGIICKSELDLLDDLRAGRLVRVLPQWMGEHYPLNAVMPSGRFVPQRVRVLVDFLAGAFAALDLEAAAGVSRPAGRRPRGRSRVSPTASRSA